MPQSVGAGDFRMTLPVPKGWTFSENSLNEWQWRPPGQPDFGYVLRVEQVLSNRRSIEWTLDRRIDELREDETNVEVLDQTNDSLHFSFITSNHLRHGYLRWLDLTGLRQRPGGDRRHRPRASTTRAWPTSSPGSVGHPARLTAELAAGCQRLDVVTESSTRLAVFRSSARIWIQSSWLWLTRITRSTVTSTPGTR